MSCGERWAASSFPFALKATPLADRVPLLRLKAGVLARPRPSAERRRPALRDEQSDPRIPLSERCEGCQLLSHFEAQRLRSDDRVDRIRLTQPLDGDDGGGVFRREPHGTGRSTRRGARAPPRRDGPRTSSADRRLRAARRADRTRPRFVPSPWPCRPRRSRGRSRGAHGARPAARRRSPRPLGASPRPRRRSPARTAARPEGPAVPPRPRC